MKHVKGAVRTTELAAILCATFENIQGTVIAYQYPHNYVSPAQFKEIGNAVIPRAELAFRLVTIEAFKHYVIGCLQRIEGVQYKRNTLQFNICLVIKPKTTANQDDISHWQFWSDHSAGGLRPNVQAAYEALTLKINRYFYALEEQCGFLSRSLGHHEGVEKCVKLLNLKSIYKQLHESGMCILSFPNSGSLYLRFSPRQDHGSYSNLSFDTFELVSEEVLKDNTDDDNKNNTGLEFGRKIRRFNLHHNNQVVFPNFNPQSESEITDYCVFVLIASPTYHCQTKMGYNLNGGWRPLDAVAQRILPYINGKRRLIELAQLAHLDVAIARLCLIELARIGLVRALPFPTFMTPLLQPDKVFDSTLIPGWLGLPRLATLLTDSFLGRMCLESVMVFNPNRHKRQSLCIHDIFRLYTILCASSNFSLSYLMSAIPHIRFIEYSSCMNSSSSRSSYHSLPFVQSKFCNCYPSPPKRHYSRISLLSLVQFGEVNGLIRRIQCYPISDKMEVSSEQTNHRMSSVISLKETSAPTANTSATNSNNVPQQLVQSQTKNSSNILRHSACKTSKKLQIISEQTWSVAKSMLMDGQHSLDSIMTFLLTNNESTTKYSSSEYKVPEYINDMLNLYRFDECLSRQTSHCDRDVSSFNRTKTSGSFSFSPDEATNNSNNNQPIEETFVHDRIWSKPENCMTTFVKPLELDKINFTLPDLYWMWR
ncbi:GATOR complex protein [Schistosoma japonicum]|uniref:GATOR complex protein n=2 Tax=Schistosoma japonicum TaxID=6182 RepID=A0A4Z2DLR7_SCHJA|nr:GATOR complex protein [Schistosoma japonicum]